MCHSVPHTGSVSVQRVLSNRTSSCSCCDYASALLMLVVAMRLLSQLVAAAAVVGCCLSCCPMENPPPFYFVNRGCTLTVKVCQLACLSLLECFYLTLCACCRAGRFEAHVCFDTRTFPGTTSTEPCSEHGSCPRNGRSAPQSGSNCSAGCIFASVVFSHSFRSLWRCGAHRRSIDT